MISNDIWLLTILIYKSRAFCYIPYTKIGKLRFDFLAHQIRISEILPWNIKSYLTNAILHRLSRKDCTLFALTLPHTVVKWRHCYFKVTSLWHVASQRVEELLGVFLKHLMRNLIVSKKNKPLFVWGSDRKIRPSWLPFGIAWRTSWCQSVTLGMDFSIPPSHSWCFLILFYFQSITRSMLYITMSICSTQPKSLSICPRLYRPVSL